MMRPKLAKDMIVCLLLFAALGIEGECGSRAVEVVGSFPLLRVALECGKTMDALSLTRANPEGLSP
jgi:hypothetical protein